MGISLNDILSIHDKNVGNTCYESDEGSDDDCNGSSDNGSDNGTDGGSDNGTDCGSDNGTDDGSDEDEYKPLPFELIVKIIKEILLCTEELHEKNIVNTS